MTEHVFRKFPSHIDAIQKLLQHNTAFREMCNDYEEISTWMDSFDRSEGPPAKEYDHARELKQELEEEIDETLRGAGFYNGSSRVTIE